MQAALIRKSPWRNISKSLLVSLRTTSRSGKLVQQVHTRSQTLAKVFTRRCIPCLSTVLKCETEGSGTCRCNLFALPPWAPVQKPRRSGQGSVTSFLIGPRWPANARTERRICYLTFPLPTIAAYIAAVTIMPSNLVFDEAFAKRPDIQQRILKAIGQLSPLLLPHLADHHSNSQSPRA